MTRTIHFFLQHIEKKQTMIKALTTLKTENSRLKEMIDAKSKQIEDMNEELQTVVFAKQNLHNIISILFSRIETIKVTKNKVYDAIQLQQQKASELKDNCKEVLEQFNTLCSKSDEGIHGILHLS